MRLRVALQPRRSREPPSAWAREVTALYTCGPAGGGGVRTALRPRLGTVSCLVPRERIVAGFSFIDAGREGASA